MNAVLTIRTGSRYIGVCDEGHDRSWAEAETQEEARALLDQHMAAVHHYAPQEVSA